MNWRVGRSSLPILTATAILALSGCSRFGLSPDDAATQQEQELAEQEQQLAELREQLAAKEAEVAESREVAGLKRQIAELEQKKAETQEPESVEPESPPPPKILSITLAEGTPILVRTTTEISTKVAVTGDSFEASLEEPLEQGTTVIAPKGARVTGIVAHSDKGGRVKRQAQLEVRLHSIVADDGQVIEVNTNTLGMSAKKSTKKDALKVGIASGVGAAIGAIAGGGKGAAIGAGAGAGAGTGAVLLTRGNAAVLPSESVLSFDLSAPVTVTREQ